MLPALLAVLSRPNAIDREVDALTRHDLLTHSAWALVDPSRMAAAAHLAQFLAPAWGVMVAAQILVLAWFWSSGRSAKLRDSLREAIPQEWLVRFCTGASLALLARLALFLPAAVQYRYVRMMDLDTLLFRTWLASWAEGTIIAMAATGVIAATVLWLADRTHQWYLYVIAAVMGFTLLFAYVAPGVIAPLTASYATPARTSAVHIEAAQLARETGIDVPVRMESARGGAVASRAYVSGWGGSQVIVVPVTLAAGTTPPELRVALAALFAFVAANAGLQIALVRGAFIIVGAALAVFISDRIGFRRDDDPVSRLALLGALMGILYVIALPFYNGYVRNVRLANDSAAVAMTHDRASAIRLEVREADQRLAAVCPGWFERWYLSAQPSPGSRISALQGQPDVCVRRR